MTKRHIAFGVGLLLIVVGGVVAWRAWTKWSAVALPPVGVAVTQSEPFDPDAPGIFYIERMAPPPSATLGDMLREADAVLVVQLYTDVTERHVTELKDISVVQPRTPMERMAGVGPVVAVPRLADYRTIYSFKVRRVIKGAMRPGDTVRIAREGGRRTFEDDFPRPGIGEQFVVFLKWWPEVGAYRHHYGPMTTFRIVRSRIHPMGQRFENQLGRREDEFVRELQASAARQPGG